VDHPRSPLGIAVRIIEVCTTSPSRGSRPLPRGQRNGDPSASSRARLGLAQATPISAKVAFGGLVVPIPRMGHRRAAGDPLELPWTTGHGTIHVRSPKPRSGEICPRSTRCGRGPRAESRALAGGRSGRRRRAQPSPFPAPRSPTLGAPLIVDGAANASERTIVYSPTHRPASSG
jgi:hypothetical protein